MQRKWNIGREPARGGHLLDLHQRLLCVPQEFKVWLVPMKNDTGLIYCSRNKYSSGCTCR